MVPLPCCFDPIFIFSLWTFQWQYHLSRTKVMLYTHWSQTTAMDYQTTCLGASLWTLTSMGKEYTSLVYIWFKMCIVLFRMCIWLSPMPWWCVRSGSMCRTSRAQTYIPGYLWYLSAHYKWQMHKHSAQSGSLKKKCFQWSYYIMPPSTYNNIIVTWFKIYIFLYYKNKIIRSTCRYILTSFEHDHCLPFV